MIKADKITNLRVENRRFLAILTKTLREYYGPTINWQQPIRKLEKTYLHTFDEFLGNGESREVGLVEGPRPGG